MTRCVYGRPGGAEDQSDDDGKRQHHGRVPAARRQTELLPDDHQQPGLDDRRHRLPSRRDRQTGRGHLIGERTCEAVDRRRRTVTGDWKEDVTL